MNFNDFAQKHLGAGGKLTHEKKVLVIVGFLAMLELVKRGAIKVTQEGKNIEMETEVVGLPNYA
jgi:chromatin segregation and condensation protein Rec8/ScpA/Scc1 (kleisin family)